MLASEERESLIRFNRSVVIGLVARSREIRVEETAKDQYWFYCSFRSIQTTSIPFHFYSM
jgi:hypothetical protein